MLPRSRVAASLPTVTALLSIVHVAPEDDTVMSPLSPSDTPPVAAIVILPAPLVMLMFDPAVRVALVSVFPVEFPNKS